MGQPYSLFGGFNTSVNERSNRPNCYACRHNYVTWDERFPCGCHAMEFKSKRLPSEVVYENSGIECQAFEDKSKPKSKPKKVKRKR